MRLKKTKTMKIIPCLKEKLIDKSPYVIKYIVLACTILYGILFYFFGGVEALVRQEIEIYSFLLFSTFTVAGFCIATGSFIRDSLPKKLREKYTKRLFGFASLFILSGVFMFSNIVVGEIGKYIKESSDIITNFTLHFFLILGATGILLFFFLLYWLIEELMKIAKVLK